MDIAGGQEAKVADFDEAFGQDVLQKSPDELLRCERGCLAAAGDKVDAILVHRQQPLVGDGDAMGIATQVVENLFASPKGFLGVDDPLLFVEGVSEASEGFGLVEFGTNQLTAAPCFFDCREELAAKEAGKDFGWK